MLKAEPPREPLTSLAAVFRDFKWRRLERGHRDPCIAYTASAPNLRTAIKRACNSRGEDGKLFFHQGRVWQVNRDAFAANLCSGLVLRRLRKADTFHALWSEITNQANLTKGIGLITTYDVTARLAAWYGFHPCVIYLHGGVLDGLRAIGVEPRGYYAHRRELPPPLRYHVNLDEVEDFLCGYRVLIGRAMGDQRVERSWG